MRRITRKDLRGLYEPAPQSLYDGIHEALAGLPEGRETRKVKKKISTGFILAAVLLALSAVGIAATRLNLFSDMTRYANPIVPLDGAEELVETGLGSAENEWATVTVEEAAYDGQGAMVLARITPKELEKYALFNAGYMEAGEDVYDILQMPAEVDEGTWKWDDDTIVNQDGTQAYYVDGKEVPVPEGRETAEKADCPVYREDGKLYYTFENERRILGRKDGKEMIGFWVDLLLEEDSGTEMGVDNVTEQPDGSVLVWYSFYSEKPRSDILRVSLRVDITQDAKSYPLEVPFSLTKSEPQRTARYVPEGDGWIGDHVKVREVNVSFTKVQAYLTVDYDYEPLPEEEMGIWLNPYDAEGNPIATGDGSLYSPDEWLFQLDCYRQQNEMQSFDEIPDVIVLDAKVTDGDSLGQCVCRLVKSE